MIRVFENPPESSTSPYALRRTVKRENIGAKYSLVPIMEVTAKFSFSALARTCEGI